MPVSPKQHRFVAEYLKDLNASQAAIRAGYSPKTAGSQAFDLLQKPEIRQLVNEAIERRSARVEVKQDDVLRELLRLARTDIGAAFDEQGHLLPLKDMPEDVRRAISGIETEYRTVGAGEDAEPVTVKKVKFWDKTRALELLGKHLKLFTDKVEVEAGESLEALILKAAGRKK